MGAPVDVNLLQARLTAAQTAYDALLTGSLREKIDHNGTSVTYSRADAERLKEYIAQLSSDIDAQTFGAPRRRRMILTVYGPR